MFTLHVLYTKSHDRCLFHNVIPQYLTLSLLPVISLDLLFTYWTKDLFFTAYPKITLTGWEWLIFCILFGFEWKGRDQNFIQFLLGRYNHYQTCIRESKLIWSPLIFFSLSRFYNEYPRPIMILSKYRQWKE